MRYEQLSICEMCWKEREGNRVPVRVKDDEHVQCAYCGAATNAGIYVSGCRRLIEIDKAREAVRGPRQPPL